MGLDGVGITPFVFLLRCNGVVAARPAARRRPQPVRLVISMRW